MNNSKRDSFLKRSREEIKKNKGVFAVYLILRIIVIGVMIAQLINRNYQNVFLCILTLILFVVPSFLEKQLKIELPNTLEIIILLFIFAAEILGEISEYYVYFPFWDTILHTINGFMFAAIGIAMIDVLNESERFAFRMSPIFVAVVAFCFSMTIGVLWEFFEFSADNLVRTDMQKDTIVTTISSINFEPEGHNTAVKVTNIEKTVIYGTMNGEEQEIIVYGYLDIGLIDTMADLFVNFVGAVIFSIIGYFYIKSRGKNRFAKHFIPTKVSSSPLSVEFSDITEDPPPTACSEHPSSDSASSGNDSPESEDMQ